MAKLIEVKRSQVKAASAKFEKLLAKDKEGKREIKERASHEKAEKTRRNKEHAAKQPRRTGR